eukprot:Em0010g783a
MYDAATFVVCIKFSHFRHGKGTASYNYQVSLVWFCVSARNAPKFGFGGFPLMYVADSPAEAKQLMVRLTQGASRQPSSGSQETFWRNLLQHLLTLRGRVFTCVEPSTCYQLPYDKSVELVVYAAREYFNFAANYRDRDMSLAKQQCFIPMDAHLNISKLLYDHLEKVSIWVCFLLQVTAADQLFSKMAVSKVSLQLAIYYARTAESSNGEPLLCPPVYSLTSGLHLLGLDGVETPVAMSTAGMPMAPGQGRTSILIANAAIEVSLQLAIYYACLQIYARTADSSNGEPLLCPPVY